LVGLVVGKAATQVAGGTATDGNAAGVNAKLATEFNYLKHRQLDDFKDKYAQCTTPECKSGVLADMKNLSDKQDALLSQCTTTEACKGLTSDAVSPTEQNGFMGMFSTDQKDIFNFCPPGDSACMGTLQYISARTNQALMVSIAPEFYAAINWQTATMESATQELQQRFGLSAQAAGVIAISMVSGVQGA
ncbi:hypothetical protein ACVBEF_21265, partial [Glaciimonas sp. GG7]